MEFKVSIIIPLYNGRNYIAETLMSCKNQTYENIEVILVDDCSTDGGYVEAKKLMETFHCPERYTYMQNSQNMGVLASCNKGADIATGDCLLFLGHDDILPNDYIAKILSTYTSDLSFVFSSPDYIDSFGEVYMYHENNLTETFTNMHFLKIHLTKECVIQSTGLIINTLFFKKIGGFDTKYKNYGEWNLWIRLLTLGDARYCKDAHALYRRHETNMTNSFNQHNKRIVLNKYWAECRRLAIKSFNLSFSEKVVANIYCIWINLKEFTKILINVYE